MVLIDRQRVHPPEPGASHGALVTAEDDDHAGLVRLEHQEPAEGDDRSNAEQQRDEHGEHGLGGGSRQHHDEHAKEQPEQDPDSGDPGERERVPLN